MEPNRPDGELRGRTPDGADVARELSYHPELDGIRALAVLAVMVFHVWPVLGGYNYLGGFLGVDVFFVLSGYLITTLLLREQAIQHKIRLGAFYARRALRLLPALALTLIFAGFVYTLLDQHPGRPFPEAALFTIFYVANWAQVKQSLGVLGHTWSLSIEEQYYLLWPAALIIGQRVVRSKRSLAVAVLAVAAGVAVARYVAFTSGHQAAAALTTITRSDGVLIGSALALALAAPPVWLRRLLSRPELALLAGAGLFGASLVVRWNTPALYQGGLFGLNLSTAVIVGFLVLRPDSFGRRALSTQPLPAIGRISYGLYLFHVPVNYLVFGHPVKRMGPAPVLLAFAASFALAGASFWFVERPVLRLKRRFGSMSRMPQVIAAESKVGEEATR
jgi:peptidoglycan/LPS O-acetylase OafA/YrhL